MPQVLETDFLPISILAPLLRTYGNIPAPVIYPPGSDPRSFSNPNPHRHQVKMDVDPCVIGSRREIDAQKADLTASEHAGVTLSEATAMVYTTSNSPANLPVVAPQTVNDVLLTKTENFIVCDVCNVICDDEKVFKKHTHLKNAQKPTLSSTMNQETPSPVANDNVDQESQEKNQNLEVIQKLIISTEVKPETTSSVAKDSLDHGSDQKNQVLLQTEAAAESLFVCAIPEPGVDYQKIATVEVDESWFKNLVPNPTSRTPVSMTPLQASKQDSKTRWCEICKVSCTLIAYDAHVSGKKHAKNLRKLENITNLPSTVAGSVTAPLAEKLQLTRGEVVNPNEGNFLRCELCGVDCNSPYVFDKHISGKKHQKKLKNNSENQLVPSPAPVAETPLPEPMDEVVISESNKRKANDTLVSEEDADTKKQKLDDVFLTCKVCNVGCYGLMAFNTHLKGYEHLAMALKQTKGGSSGL